MKKTKEKIEITITDGGTFCKMFAKSGRLTVIQDGGCPVEEILAGIPLTDKYSVEDISRNLMTRWLRGYDGDAHDSGLRVEVRRGEEVATIYA